MKNLEDIKTYSYGYGELEDRLISLLKLGEPDLETASELIRLGADINADGKDDDENMLSEILKCYAVESKGGYLTCKETDCRMDYCPDCPKYRDLNPDAGASMIRIIRFFLDNGFDPDRKEGRVGAQCLSALAISVFDSYIIDAAKLLLDHGARIIRISKDPGDSETPLESIGMEGSVQDMELCNHHMGNIFEAVYQIYLAAKEGRPYASIDSYEKILGKRIIQVLSDIPEGREPFFELSVPGSSHENSYAQDLYFLTDEGAFITTQYADLWFDSMRPYGETVDVTEFFPGIVGSVVKEVRFGHNEINMGTRCYGQPVTTLLMENGKTLTLTINYGEADEKDRAAYFTLGS